MTLSSRRALARAGIVACALSSLNACADRATAPMDVPETATFVIASDDGDAVGTSEYLAGFNRQQIASGSRVAAARVELLVSGAAAASTPKVLLANNRSLRYPTRWVPADIRRLSTDNTLSYAVFSPLAKATVGGPSEAAFDASFASWNAVSCSKLQVRRKALAPGQFPSFLLTGLFPPADINDVGFLPMNLFSQVLGPNVAAVTLGLTVTFTFIQIGQNGQPVLDENGSPVPTDVDGDGRGDTAFKEVWFNDAMAYSTTGAANRFDIESVALHEHGHALELDHFGRITGDTRTGKLQASPRAVMNAAIIDTQRAPLGTDKAALCGQFAGWP